MPTKHKGSYDWLIGKKFSFANQINLSELSDHILLLKMKTPSTDSSRTVLVVVIVVVPVVLIS